MTSYLQDAFNVWLNQHPEIPPPIEEHVFAPPRKWRFDFAWPDHMLAVEIEGLTRDGGRHQTFTGFIKDAEKYEAAFRLGWRVYRLPGPWIAEPRRYIWRPQVMETLADALNGVRTSA